MSFTRQELQTMAQSAPIWFYSIELGQGVTTNGWKSHPQLRHEAKSYCIPDLRGKSVLGINAWDGVFSFEAERRGATKIVALDYYMWAMDFAAQHKYWTDCKDRGVVLVAYHQMLYYLPERMPGKAGFDTARKALKSTVSRCGGRVHGNGPKTFGTF